MLISASWLNRLRLKLRILFDVRGSVHLTLLTKKPNKIQQSIKILLFLILNEAQRVSGETPPIISSLKLHKQSLVLRTW
jgi:hypothetical protein